MEKEFVPYEQALDLKELGFDEPCFSYIKHLGYDSSKEKVKILSEVTRSQIEDMGLPLLKIPTFSQAFRWFRDKYKISGEISSDYYLEGKDNEWEYNIYQLGKEDDGYVGTINIFKTYEEAELECLKKLIEIVKEKQNG